MFCLCGWVPPAGSTHPFLYSQCKREFQSSGGFPGQVHILTESSLLWGTTSASEAGLLFLMGLHYRCSLEGAHRQWGQKGFQNLVACIVSLAVLHSSLAWKAPPGHYSLSILLMTWPTHLVFLHIHAWGRRALLRLPSDARLEVRNAGPGLLSSVGCCCVALPVFRL